MLCMYLYFVFVSCICIFCIYILIRLDCKIAAFYGFLFLKFSFFFLWFLLWFSSFLFLYCFAAVQHISTNWELQFSLVSLLLFLLLLVFSLCYIFNAYTRAEDSQYVPIRWGNHSLRMLMNPLPGYSDLRVPEVSYIFLCFLFFCICFCIWFVLL